VDYVAAEAYLYSLADAERSARVQASPRTYDLNRFRQLLSALSEPQRRVPAVHVAGTKGKGSVAAMVESVLRAAGLRTGLFTSPHLLDIRERIRLSGRCVGRSSFARLTARVRRAAENYGLEITTFEALTAMAFLHFAERGADVQVLEVGLGGRLDTTNVVTPLIAVITPISFDHTAILGTTLDQIAREKAGIIKPGVPVVVAAQPPEALSVIEATAARRAAPLWLSGRDFGWSAPPARPDFASEARFRQRLQVWIGALTPRPPLPMLGEGESPLDLSPETGAAGRGAASERDSPSPSIGRGETVGCPLGDVRARLPQAIIDLTLPLLGRHQLENAATATAAARALSLRGLAIDDSAIWKGISRVRWPGRLQVLCREPWVVVDGAHNGASAQALATALADHFRHRRRWLVVGVAADKDLAAIAAALAPGAAGVIATRTVSERAAPPERVAAAFGGIAESAPSVAAALDRARARAAPDDLICATGSLLVAAEALAWVGVRGPCG
jgi:dihydrofolate synthase/folylpolyglutamate synthase